MVSLSLAEKISERANREIQERAIETVLVVGTKNDPPRERLFRSVHKWMGSPKNNYHAQCLLPTVVMEVNRRLGLPFSGSEVEDIARKCEERLLQFDPSQEGLQQWRRERALHNASKSAKVRRERLSERDTAILKDRAKGLTQKAVAAKHGITQGRVSQIEKRHREELRRAETVAMIRAQERIIDRELEKDDEGPFSIEWLMLDAGTRPSGREVDPEEEFYRREAEQIRARQSA